MTRYVSFEEFIRHLRDNDGAWSITQGSDGLILSLVEGGVNRTYHSPDPINETDADWGLFSSRIAAVIDANGANIRHARKKLEEGKMPI